MGLSPYAFGLKMGSVLLTVIRRPNIITSPLLHAA
jgi:hypothetical protein